MPTSDAPVLQDDGRAAADDRLTDILEVMRDASKNLQSGNNNSTTAEALPASKRSKLNAQDLCHLHLATARACGVSETQGAIGEQSALTTELIRSFTRQSNENKTPETLTSDDQPEMPSVSDAQQNVPVAGDTITSTNEAADAADVAAQVKDYEVRLKVLKSIQTLINQSRREKEKRDSVQAMQQEIESAQNEVNVAREQLESVTHKARAIETEITQLRTNSDASQHTQMAEERLTEALADLTTADEVQRRLQHATRTLIAKYAASGVPAAVALDYLTHGRRAPANSDTESATDALHEGGELECQLDELKLEVAARCGIADQQGGANSLPVIEAVYGLVADSLLTIDRSCPTDPTDARAVCMLALDEEENN
jgi:chromosome segregation ATPase